VAAVVSMAIGLYQH